MTVFCEHFVLTFVTCTLGSHADIITLWSEGSALQIWGSRVEYTNSFLINFALSIQQFKQNIVIK